MQSFWTKHGVAGKNPGRLRARVGGRAVTLPICPLLSSHEDNVRVGMATLPDNLVVPNSLSQHA